MKLSTPKFCVNILTALLLFNFLTMGLKAAKSLEGQTMTIMQGVGGVFMLAVIYALLLLFSSTISFVLRQGFTSWHFKGE